jgi:hypothetical protein
MDWLTFAMGMTFGWVFGWIVLFILSRSLMPKEQIKKTKRRK